MLQLEKRAQRPLHDFTHVPVRQGYHYMSVKGPFAARNSIAEGLEALDYRRDVVRTPQGLL